MLVADMTERAVVVCGMLELAKSEFTPELEFRGSEFDKSSKKVHWSPLQGMGV
jgi:hypothetical protein